MTEWVGTVYDGTRWIRRLPFAILPALIGVGWWTVFDRARVRIKSDKQSLARIVSVFALVIGSLYSAYLLIWLYGDATVEASGRLLVADGPIGTIEHSIKPSFGKGQDIVSEAINVNGVRFLHDNNPATPGFHIISDEDGPLIEGCHVRIDYTAPLEWNLPVTRIVRVQIVHDLKEGSRAMADATNCARPWHQ